MIELGGVCWVMTRKVWPPSTEPNHVLRCVPVPVGPLTKTRPCGSMAMSGSPFVWIGSTTVGTWKPIAELEFAVAPALATGTVAGLAPLNKAANPREAKRLSRIGPSYPKAERRTYRPQAAAYATVWCREANGRAAASCGREHQTAGQQIVNKSRVGPGGFEPPTSRM